MIIEIKPHKHIGKNSLYFKGHYLGKNNKRNAFICAADEICSSEVVIDNEKINGSWLQQAQKIKRNKNAVVNYLLTKKEAISFSLFLINLGHSSLLFLKTMKKLQRYLAMYPLMT